MSALAAPSIEDTLSNVVFMPPTEKTLVERARALIPTLLARASACDAGRKVPDETIEDFRNAGFFNILKLPEYGGYGMTILTLARVIQEVGRGCMPSAWVLFVLGSHQYELALLNPQVAKDIYEVNPNALIGSSYAPLGSMVKVDGGYQLKGTWRFCSGIDHADWVGVGGMVMMPGASRPDFRTCLVHKSKFVIDQNSWHTIGLAGTGSKDFTISDVFVPDHHSHSMMEAHLMLGQDKLPAWNRYSYWQVVNMSMASAIIGGAQGAVDEFQRQFATRTNNFSAGKAGDDPFVKARLGQAVMLVNGAKARVQAICLEMARLIEAGEEMPVDVRLGWSAETAQCGKMCEDAVMLLFKATGARGLQLENPIQAILRNVFGGSNHIAMNVEGVNSAVGNLMLGRENMHFAC